MLGVWIVPARNQAKRNACDANHQQCSRKILHATIGLRLTRRVNDPAQIGSRLQHQRDRGVRFGPIVSGHVEHV